MTALIAVLAACGLIVSLTNHFQISGMEKKIEAKATDARKFAGTLVAQKLFRDAASYLEGHLEKNPVAPEERESILLYLAGIYQENLSDHEKAMATYLRLLHEFPATRYRADAERRIVECKEKLGRRFEALNDMAALSERERESAKKPSAAAGTGEVAVTVARIGEETMTMKDFAYEVDSLFQKSLPEGIDRRETKIRLLKDIIAQKVLKKVATMKRIDMNPDIIKKAEAARTQLLIQKLLQDEVASKVTVDEMSMRLYYDAHRSEMTLPDTYRFSYIETADATEAVNIARESDAKRFFEKSPKEAQPGTLHEVSAAIGADLSVITSEIALAKPGEIVKAAAPSANGMIVLKLSEVKRGELVPFESVKERIRHGLLEKKREEEIQSFIMKCFADLNVVIYEEAFREAVSADTKEVRSK